MSDSNCISCNTAPPPCNCSPSQTCVQTPRTCSTCPQNICINSSGSSNSNSSDSSSLGGTIGGIVGGLVAAGLIIFAAWLLYRRRLLPSFFYPKKSSSKTRSSNKGPSFKSKSSRPHQSVIYLPTDNRDPKTTSGDSDDDHDPFSDKHSGVSIIGPSPQLRAASPGIASASTIEFLVSAPNPSVPAAYIPPHSKSLSIADVEERDGGRKTPDLALNNNPTTTLTTSSASLSDHGQTSTPPIAASVQRSSFLAPSGLNLPTPSLPAGNSANPFKPIRPHRAPDLNLQLPSAPESISDAHESLDEALLSPNNLKVPGSNSRQNLGSLDGMPEGSRLSLGSDRSDALNSKRISCSSDATHDSHLSSILDPAMIVTPVTLVRTASGRQAAVQRVALRGQEKARVVRLPPNSTLQPPHGPSPLSSSTAHNPVANTNVRETFGFSSKNSTSEMDSNFDPTATDLAVLSHSNTQSTSSHEVSEENQSTGLRRGRSTAAYSMASSSFCGSSVCDSFIEDEEVEFPTVLGRSAAFLAHRQQSALPVIPSTESPSASPGSDSIAPQADSPLEPTATTSSHHHHHPQTSTKPLGRDRAISLSSIITEEAARTSFSSSTQPPLPTNVIISHPTKVVAGGGSNSILPHPFKPFAGQKPNTTNLGRKSHSTGRRTPKTQEQTQSIASTTSSNQSRLSTVSSIRSGYGSVLEGIPFNIGFNSESDDLLLFNNNNNLSESIGIRESTGLVGGRMGVGISSSYGGSNNSAAEIMGFGADSSVRGSAGRLGSESSFGLTGHDDVDHDYEEDQDRDHDGIATVVDNDDDDDGDVNQEFEMAIPSTPSTIIGSNINYSSSSATPTINSHITPTHQHAHDLLATRTTTTPGSQHPHPSNRHSTQIIDSDEANLVLAYLSEA